MLHVCYQDGNRAKRAGELGEDGVWVFGWYLFAEGCFAICVYGTVDLYLLVERQGLNYDHGGMGVGSDSSYLQVSSKSLEILKGTITLTWLDRGGYNRG